MEKDLQDLFDSHGGILKTGELLQSGYYHRKLQKLIKNGEIEQVRRGYYQLSSPDCFRMLFFVWRVHWITMATQKERRLLGILLFRTVHPGGDFIFCGRL